MPVDNGPLRIEAWGNFYLATSAASATLVGLLFVIITLAAERRPRSESERIRVYLTPTVAYFASVLLLATALTFPTQSRLSATLCCVVVGAVGTVYALSLLRNTERFRERQDRWPYAFLPAGAFGLVGAGGVLMSTSDSNTGMTIVATAVLGLLAIGLRNSWAMAVTIISTH